MKSLLLTALVAGASVLAITPAAAKDHVVLVHGAFADASSWDKVKAGLVAKGYAVTAVEIPLTSLADDVAATRAAIDAQDGPVVLVGHSWGGAVIGEAGDSPKVKWLVYVAAFAPDQGESIASLSQGGPPSDGVKAIRPDNRGYLTIDPAAFPAVFAGDLPVDEAQALAARQRPVNSASFGTASVVAAWKVKPTFYAVMTEDRTIPAQVQHLFAGRMKATTVEVKASHAGLISQPEAVVEVIEAAAH
ncbi:hypothetical protein ABAC460_21240 [Asticcacaulis sp. AC460]|uniref:alpha/beta fold hydrolase n=1 Tax=Asticcacaulis sp. AC460 TaxID=1282360 RepID=UPI0003C3D6D5|nr:alpha/beta hydrolase [Asticcacaulis sp. AC460]ESQ87097.1 hypothetical protein ABAC460_21240 [Asticcacaulis sp. AC460]